VNCADFRVVTPLVLRESDVSEEQQETNSASNNEPSKKPDGKWRQVELSCTAIIVNQTN
jgi:hypothetical protein